MAYDPAVIRAIKRIGRRRGMDEEAVLGALSTGIVESGLTNIRGGDADSSGWRQERASLYPNPNNLSASINRFYDEWEQHDRPGFNPGLTAANVQRPAEQYRGRYAEQMDEARKILGGDWSGAGGAVPSVGSPQVLSQAPQQNPFEVIGQLQAGMPQNPYAATQQRGWELLGQLWDKKYGGQQTAAPSSSLPAGGSIPKGGKIAGGLHEAFFDPVGGWDEGKSIGAIGGHGTHAHFGGDPAAVARIVRIAQRPKWGLDVREYAPVDKVDPVHTEGSWHYKHGGKGGADISGDQDRLDDFFKRILRKAGWR